MKKKIMFSADWHLGKTQYNKKEREHAFLNAALLLIDEAHSNNVPIIVVAGDILDSVHPSADTMIYLKNLHKLLIRYKMCLYTISGNHDFTNKHWVSLFEEDDNDYGFKMLDNKTVNIYGINIHGIKGFTKQDIVSYTNNTNLEDINILITHSSCKQFVAFNGNKEDTLDYETDIDYSKLPNLQYIIVGDTHVSKEVNINNIKVVSPGSIEMCSSAEDIVKQCYMLYIEDDKVTSEFIDLKTDALRLKSPILTTTEEVDDFLNLLTEELKLHTTTNQTIIYFNYNFDVIDAVKKIKSFIKNKNNITVVYNAKRDKVQKDATKLDDVTINKNNKEILSLDEFVKQNVNLTKNLSEAGNRLFLNCLDKNITNIKSLINDYVNS